MQARKALPAKTTVAKSMAGPFAPPEAGFLRRGINPSNLIASVFRREAVPRRDNKVRTEHVASL